jgi:drug/metabolite transporter (DMT)-like permease
VAANLGVALNPFFADPLISTYFIFTIFFSRIIMREKFDKRQYLCVAVILICVVIFAVLDK